MLGSCQRRKTIGQHLSVGLDSGGTAGSTGNKIDIGRELMDSSGVKTLLRMHMEHARRFSENFEAVWDQLIEIMSNKPDSFLMDMQTGKY